MQPELASRSPKPLLLTGRVFWVMNTSDQGYEKFKNEHPAYLDEAGGVIEAVYNSASAGYAAMTSNQNDLCIFGGHGTHTLTSMLTISKNRCNFMGADGGGRQTGHGAKLSMGVTTAATDLAPVKNTGVRNSFRNIKFMSSNTKAESLYGHIEAGEFALYENCSFLKTTDLDQTAAADVVAEGDSTTWRDCEFGAATVLVSVARATVLVDKIVGTTGMLDNNFIGCNFVKYSSSADALFFKVNATGDGQRYCSFKGCHFNNWSTAAAGTAITNAFSAGSGNELMFNIDATNSFIGCTNVAASPNNVGIYVSGAVPTAATSNLAVQAA
ncbi:MAG: hypothetical protein U9R08_02930 [Nanoarchaeota archaeon]|nr:hypothetical protein [Nanoarchaeota archaeon]